MPTDAARIEAALAAGRTFEAVDLACGGARDDAAPGKGRAHRAVSWLAATALLRSGATAAAEAMVAELERGGRRPVSGQAGALRARLLEELWQATGRGADLDRALAVRLARARAGGGAEKTAAALLAKANGQDALAARLAAAARNAAAADPADPAGLLDRVRLAFLQAEPEAAEAPLAALAELLERRPLERAMVRHALLGLEAYRVMVPEVAIEAFAPPRLVIYCGARDPGLAGEPAVAAAIREALEAVGAEIVYGSAAAGADLLFAEAALDRGAEVNLVLPCGVSAFRAGLVAPAGEPWVDLFDRVTAAAASMVSVAEDRDRVDDVVLGFGNRVIDGTARLRAEELGARPFLIAACDPLADSGGGGPADFIDHWGDPARLRLVDLDELGLSSATSAAPVALAAGVEQRIVGLLFADIVGFARLDDALLPQFWRFMAAVAGHMREAAGEPSSQRSWGDALFITADNALAPADSAIALADAFAAVDARQFGLPREMAIRIALHAGPVFAGRHPMTGEAMLYGGNVNRAARIEPITVPGQVYASAQFVAWLKAEESAAEAETRLAGGIYRPRYRCTYRGVVELAKRYGSQAVYEVATWRAEGPMAEARIDGTRLAMTLANDPAEHRRLAAAFAEFLGRHGIDETQLVPFEIAFDEVVTNICRYAWQDAGQHAIEVAAVLDGDRVVVTFSDDGIAFDPLAGAPVGLDDDIEEREIGGLGIHLVRELMDELRYVRDGSCNRLILTRRLVPEAGAHEEEP